MVLTRYQAALAHFLGQSPQYSDDDEVELNTEAHHSVLQGDDGDSISTQAEDIIDMADQEGERLEAVETAVREMNTKFDSLLVAVTQGQRAAPHTPVGRQGHAPAGTAARQQHRHVPLLPQGIPPPPPDFPTHQGLRGPSYDEYVLEQLRREEFFGPRTDDGKGFATDFFNKPLAPKPYMYLTKQGVNTLKKKLEARESMTFQEYILAYIRMVRDPRAAQSHLIYYHMEHLQNLAEDAIKRDWGAARSWSQSTLDDIEAGVYSWEDTQTIQMQRLSWAINAPRADFKQNFSGLGGGETGERDPM